MGLGAFAKDLETPLLKLSPAGDVFTCGDGCDGVHIFGGIGSGKSSGSGRMIAGAYLRAGMGGLVTAAKFDEIELWQGYTKKHGRARSLILFDENEGFNFLDYLMEQQGFDGIGTVTEAVMRVIDVGRRVTGSAGKGGDAFWADGARMGLRNCLPLLYSAFGKLRIPDIMRFISTAPTSVKEANDAAWRERSFAYEVFDKAIHKPAVPLKKNTLRSLIDFFWGEQWPAIPARTLGNIVITINAALDRFNSGRINRAFCQNTSIVPELSFGGGIILPVMPTLTWNEDGVIAQCLLKFLWQRAVLRRASLDNSNQERFVFLWSDEGQETVDPNDGAFLALCRQSKCCVTYLSQSIPGYIAKIGGDTPKDAAESLVGKFMTHVYHSNSCPVTNEYAAKTLGRVMKRRGTYSRGSSESRNVGMSAGNSETAGWSSTHGSSYGDKSASVNHGGGSNSGSGNNWGQNRGHGKSQSETEGYSESMEYEIEPGDFGRILRTGGARNNHEVTAIWYRTGRIYEASGTNWLKVRFTQK